MKGYSNIKLKECFTQRAKEMPEICVETLKISYSPRVMTHSFTKFSHIAQFMVSMISFFFPHINFIREGRVIAKALELQYHGKLNATFKKIETSKISEFQFYPFLRKKFESL